jgi:hypothetical protein
MKRRAAMLAAAVIAAGILHAIAGHHLAAHDPISALLGHAGGGVAVAATGLTIARLFLYFVAPGWAACFVTKCLARAIAAGRSVR